VRRFVGLTSDELETRERVFDGLTARAIRRSLRALSFQSVMTAATEITLSAEPPPPNPTIPAGALGVVTTTWTQEVDDVLFPYVVQTFIDAAEDVHAVLLAGVPKITYDLAATYLAGAKNRLTGIGDVVWDDMRTQLALGYEAGESIEQLATRLRQVAKISEPRAQTIARTEVVPAANFGSLQQLKVAGFTDDECQKEWLATNDARTREAHRLADGQRVGVNQPFKVDGDFLQVPGDPTGRYENVVNCRCSIAYVFADDEEDETLTADAAFEKKHPRDDEGQFTESPVSQLNDGISKLETIFGVELGRGTVANLLGPAHVNYQTGKIEINPDEVARLHNFRDRKLSVNGIVPMPGDIWFQAGVHEGSHDLARRYLSDAEQVEALRVAARAANLPDVPADEYMNATDGWASRVERESQVNYELGTGKVSRELSAYGSFTNHEAFAEALMEYALAEKPRPFAQALGDYVKKHVQDKVLTADARFEALHPRADDGRFGVKSPFTILPKELRGKSGDGMYAPGMWGKYGAAGVMMRHVDERGTPRYLLVQRANPGKNQWKWQLPGGALEQNETPAQGAAREAFEEIGAMPELLESLQPRGEHSILRPVEGKAPWRYTNVVADSPTQFKPRVDRQEGELWKAVWLTEEQIREMMTRDRLVAPLAAEIDSILAKYDELLVAGFNVITMTAGSPTVTDQDYYDLVTASSDEWTAADEAKHPRDSEGKFAKKAGLKKLAQAALAPGKPLHINIKVIYTTKYTDGAVVAEKDDLEAGLTRLVWDADKKKFALQGVNVDGNWFTAEVYTKKDAYAKFSKETGWFAPHTPASLASLGSKPLAAPPKTKKAVAPVAHAALGVPVKLNTVAIYKTKYADGTVVAERTNADGTRERITWSAGNKKFLLQKPANLTTSTHWVTVNTFSKGDAYKTFSKQTGWTQPASPAPLAAPSIAPKTVGVLNKSILDMNEAELVTWLDENADILVYVGMTYTLEKALAKHPAAAAKFAQITAPKKAKPVPNFLTDSYGDIIKFYEELTQDDFDALSAGDQELLKIEAPFFDVHGTYSEKVEKFATGKKDAGVPTTPTTHADPVDVFYDWDDISGPEDTTPVFYAGSVIAYAKSTFDGSGAFLYVAQPDSLGSYVSSVDFNENETVESKTAELLDSGLLTPDSGGSSVPGTPTAPVAATPITLVTPAPPSGSKFHVDVHEKIKKVGEIGVPNPPAKTIDIGMIWPTSSDLVSTGEVVGSHGSTIYRDKNTGKRYLFKRYPSSNFLAEIDVATADLQAQVGLPAARITKMTVDGTPGTLHEIIENSTSAFSSKFKPTSLTAKDILDLQKNQVFDWLISNHDSHMDNFLRVNGDLVAVDKGQAFKYLGRDKLDVDFKPNEHSTVYNTLMKAYVIGEIDLNDPKTGELHSFIQQVEAISDAEYREMLRPYAEKAAAKNVLGIYHASPGVPQVGTFSANDVEAFLDAAVQRKNNLTSDFTHFYAQLTDERNKGIKISTSVPSVAITPTLGPISFSDLKQPMKITTKVIHTTQYAHGAVVAYKKIMENGQPALHRLVWSDIIKKFILQKRDPDADTGWVNFTSHSKKDAYATFGKQTTWYAPPAGDSAIGSGGGAFGTSSVVPKISTSGPAPSVAVTAPAIPPKPQPKFDVATLQAQYGQIPTDLSPATQQALFGQFKKKTSLGTIVFASSPDQVFSALYETLEKHNDEAGTKLSPKLNLLQLLKIVDIESANKATAIAKQSDTNAPEIVNTHAYEKKIVDWLQTPAGAKFATDLLHPPPPATVNGHVYKSNFSPAVLATLAKIKTPGQIGTPDSSVTIFKTLKVFEAQNLQSQMLADNPWTGAQKAALTKYSGQYYSKMNPVIRDLASNVKYMSEDAKLLAARTAVNIQAGMRPLPESVRVFRQTGASQFPGLTNSSKYADIKKFEGKLFTDRAPLSTSVTQGTWVGNVHLTIDLPAGTPAAFIKSISSNPSEDEMLLALGLNYRVISVKDTGHYGVVKVHLRVEA
jgi:8-oxo-dGTP pyrophosphatase MutT (NUDIX family)